MSHVVRKPDFCICKKKGQISYGAADQRLCFRYIDSTTPLLSKSPSVAAQPGLSWTWSDTPKTGFLALRLICISSQSLLFAKAHLIENLEHYNMLGFRFNWSCWSPAVHYPSS